MHWQALHGTQRGRTVKLRQCLEAEAGYILLALGTPLAGALEVGQCYLMSHVYKSAT